MNNIKYWSGKCIEAESFRLQSFNGGYVSKQTICQTELCNNTLDMSIFEKSTLCEN